MTQVTPNKLEAIRIIINEHPLGFNIYKLLKETKRFHPIARVTFDKFLHKEAVRRDTNRNIVELFESKFGELTDEIVTNILDYQTVLASIIIGGVCENCCNYWNTKCSGTGQLNNLECANCVKVLPIKFLTKLKHYEKHPIVD